MYFKSLIILICIFIFKFNTVIALTQDLSLTILVRSPITMEYVLAKSVCKLLDRELRISHSFGGSNTLDCLTRLDDSVDEIIKKIEQNQFQYAIIKKADLANRPSRYQLRHPQSFIRISLFAWSLLRLWRRKFNCKARYSYAHGNFEI